MTTDATDLFDCVKAAYAAGLSVVPPRQDGTKQPYPSHWLAYQEKRPSQRQLNEWYQAGLTGIGVVTGKVSNNLELFEFDWFDTFVAFREVAAQAGLSDLVERIHEGYSERTPGNGVHWYYYCEEIAPNAKLASRPAPTDDNPRGVKVLIETRGEGGYSIMAPSNGTVHPTGKPYEVLAGTVTGIVTITPAERAALWQLARSFDEMPERPIEAPRPQGQKGDRPGDLFNSRRTWREILEPDGWKLVYTRGQTGYWRRPGKPIGISATTNHTGNDTLIVFSSSTPFETQPTSYSKFAAYAVLYHQGDYAAAGKALWRDGYREGAKASPPPQREEEVDEETGEIREKALLAGRVLLDDVLAKPIPPPDWLINGFLVRGFIHLLYGESGHGKTTVGLEFIRQIVARGETVVFIDEESGHIKIAGLMQDMGISNVDEHLHYFQMPGIGPDDINALFAYLDSVRPSLVVFDSLTDQMSNFGLDDNSSVQVVDWFKAVPKTLALRDYRPCVLLLDHVTKLKDNVSHSAGSRAKRQKSDVLWYLEKVEDFNREKLGKVTLTLYKDNPGTMPAKHTLAVGTRDGRLICEPFNAMEHGGRTLTEKHEKFLSAINDVPRSNAELQGILECGHATVVRLAQDLIDLSLIERTGVSRMTKYQLCVSWDESFVSSDETVSSHFSSHGGGFKSPHETKRQTADKRPWWEKLDDDEEDLL